MKNKFLKFGFILQHTALILTLLFSSFVFLKPQKAFAQCLYDFSFTVKNLTKGTDFTTPQASFQFKPEAGVSYEYYLNWDVSGCGPPEQQRWRYLQLLSQVANGQGEQEKSIAEYTSIRDNRPYHDNLKVEVPSSGGIIFYFRLHESEDFSPLIAAKSIGVIIEGNGDNGGQEDYYPTKGAVCKISDTSVKIWWVTNKSVLGKVFYADHGGEAGSSIESAKKKRHSFKLTDLIANHDYYYQVYSLSSDGTEIAHTDEISFKTGADNEPGCSAYESGGVPPDNGDTQPNPNQPPAPPTPIVCKYPDGRPPVTITTGQCPPGSVVTNSVPPSVADLYNPIQSDSLIGLGFRLMKGFLGGVAALAIVFIVMGSIRLIVSRGNPEQLTRGKDILIWSILGLVVALMAFSLTAIVQNLLGAF